MLFGLDIYESKFNTNNVWFQSREGFFSNNFPFYAIYFMCPWEQQLIEQSDEL